MKKIVTLFSLFCFGYSASAQLAQLPNGDFENWDQDVIYQTPTSWKTSDSDQFFGTPTAKKTTDASDGVSAIRLEVEMISGDPFGGYVYLGEIGDGPEGGVAYTDVFNEIKMSYKSNLLPGDTLSAMIVRFANSNVVSMEMLPLATGTHNDWSDLTVSLGSTPQEEVFIGLVIGEPGSSAIPNIDSWVMIDNVQLAMDGNLTSSLPNNSFETWEDTSVENPQEWHTINSLLTTFDEVNVEKTTDAFSGDYAVKITGVDIDEGDAFGFLSLGAIDLNNPEQAFSTVPFVAAPTTITGAYKYTATDDDTGGLQAIFIENNQVIGVLAYPFLPTNEYTEFSANITINGTPDEMLFLASTGENIGSELYLDDLAFAGGTTQVDEPISSIDFEVFPNPSAGEVTVKLPDLNGYDIIVMNLQGKIVLQEKQVTQHFNFDATSLESGVYFIQVSSGNDYNIKKLTIN